MNVSEDFNDLGHDDNFFDDFFENVWNFNNDFLSKRHFIRSLLNLLYNLDNFFDVVYVFNDFFHLFHNGYLLNDSFNFNHLVSDIGNWDDFLLFNFDFPNFFNYLWNFHNLFYKFLHVLVDLDYLRDDSFDLNDLWDFD